MLVTSLAKLYLNLNLAGVGHNESLQEVREGFLNGCVAKDEFEKTLHAHRESVDEEMQSDQRDKSCQMCSDVEPFLANQSV